MSRFREQRATLLSDNAFAIGAILPPHVMVAPVSALVVPIRLKNAFLANDVRTIRDVLTLGEAGLRSLPNVGVKSIQALASAFDEVMERFGQLEDPPAFGELSASRPGGATSADVTSYGSNDPLVQATGEVVLRAQTLRIGLELALSSLRERDRLVVEARLGWTSAPRKLEDIGGQLGVTRERARQIESRGMREVRERFNWQSLIESHLHHLFVEREEPLYLDLLAAEDFWFDGFQGELGLLARLITEGAPRFHCVDVDGREVVTTTSVDQWKKLCSDVRASLASQIPSRLSRSEVDALLDAICRFHGATDLIPLIQRSLEGSLHFAADSDGREFLVAIGEGLRGAVSAILQSATVPLHISVIRRCLAERGCDQPTDNYLRLAINWAGGEVFGRSLFGTTAHIPIAEDRVADVLDEVRALMDTAPDRQWHCAELVDGLLTLQPDLPEELDKYALNVILKCADFASYLGRLIWVVRDDVRVSTRDRHQIDDLVEDILKQAGRPLKTREIRDRIRRIRGVNSSCQLFPSDRVRRLGWGRWGLLDRDFSLDNGQVIYALDQLANVLMQSCKAIHISELPRILAAFGFFTSSEADEVVGYAQLDDRFRFGKGQLIGLAAWPDMNRFSTKEALAAIAADATAPMHISVIHRRVEELLGRPIARNSLASRLPAHGFDYRACEGWVFCGESDEVDVADNDRYESLTGN